MSVQTRYNLSQKYFTVLPWNTIQDLPNETSEWYNNFLENYKPRQCDKDSIYNQVQILCKINKKFGDNKSSAFAAFRLLDANMWILRENPRLYEVICSKLNGISESEEYYSMAMERFGHILDMGKKRDGDFQDEQSKRVHI